MADCLPLRTLDDNNTILTVRVTPKSSKDALDAIAKDDADRAFLKVKVRAVPENGAANKAVCKLLAKELGLAKSHVRLHSGETSRLKQVLISARLEDIQHKLLNALRG
ncbi:DUF167 family protein [Ponticaulis profundi]|uniref:UPF0235 protein ACFQDM_19520 n=1 Tax=Ponticaulis profundi TaxID=2665222 RepID=A0ABW1SG40_9PROT